MEEDKYFRITGEENRKETIRHIQTRATDLSNEEWLSKLKDNELVAIKVCLDGLGCLFSG